MTVRESRQSKFQKSRVFNENEAVGDESGAGMIVVAGQHRTTKSGWMEVAIACADTAVVEKLGDIEEQAH